MHHIYIFDRLYERMSAPSHVMSIDGSTVTASMCKFYFVMMRSLQQAGRFMWLRMLSPAKQQAIPIRIRTSYTLTELSGTRNVNAVARRVMLIKVLVV
jgi:hypothetical protein